MTPDQLRKGLELSAAATEGEWYLARHKYGWGIDAGVDRGICSVRDNTDGSRFAEHKADAAFIAYARTALPEALGFIVELLWDKFNAAAHIVEKGKNAGWYDSCCHSDACEAADYLIPMGLMKEKPGRIGRRRFYRPIEQEKAHD